MAPSPENVHFGFDKAVSLLKKGKFVTRECWNGKDTYLHLVETTCLKNSTLSHKYKLESHVLMLTTQGKSQAGWQCSQRDMLANDWLEVTPPSPKNP